MSEGNIQQPDQATMAEEWATAPEGQEATLNADAGDTNKAQQPVSPERGKDASEDRVQRANFEVLSRDDKPQADVQDETNLDVVLDIPVTLSIEIGRTRISIRNLLQLNQGSVVELDRLAGEPLDMFVNGILIAHGEVVMVNEKFGIRLTDVISPTERIKKLK